MKVRIAMLIGVFVVLGLFSTVSAYDRTVLVEDFTNWGCPPCAPASTLLHNAIENYTPDEAFDIAYHMSWPSGDDPFYLANPSENDTRRYYYGVNAVPHMRCDGLIQMSTVSQSAMEASINSRLAIPSHIWLDLSTEVVSGTIEMTCTAVADRAISGDVSLQMLVLDRYSYLPESPNGNPDHYHAMLDMSPNGSGQTFNVAANDTTYFYGSFPISASWAIDNLDIACFVQDNSTWEVLQSHVEQFPVDFPGLYYVDYTLEDNGNNDGRAEPGETAYLYVTLGNQPSYQTAVNVVGTLSTDDPDLDITTATVDFPDIPNGESGTNTDPFVFDVSPTAQPHLTSLHLEVVADPLQTVYETDIEMYIGWPDILLVDDDGGGIFEQYYQSALDSLGKSYEYWDINASGVPSPSTIEGYPITIWFTGFVSSDVISAPEQLLIEGYLDNGGFLFMSGQNIAQGLNSSAPDFLHDVLHAEFGTANTQNKVLNGTGPDPIWNALSVDCNPGGAGSGSCTNPDGISVISPAEETFIYSNGSYYGGLAYEDATGAKLVFFSFPFEAISGQNATNSREEILDAVLEYFGPITAVEPAGDVSIPVTYAAVYPNPFNPQTSIRYQLSKSGPVNLDVFDLSGAHLLTLVEGWRSAGSHRVVFNGENLSSGIYIYRLQTTGMTQSGKMVLLK